ncbi:MAG TPA: class I SAM-dependent methyltransferase [Clostridia bacterium]|nr:class I SAM-dependent methyltransferase [Clostridia bacterium]
MLVPSSGDNAAVFAFRLLGATVTSTDISERQLENARRIAVAHDWDIRFVCDDSISLTKIEDGVFDLVYTSNGVHIWIHDLLGMYRCFHRVSKKDGRYIMYEVHPVIRPFGDDDVPIITVCKPYENIDINDGVQKFAWRIQDIFNAAFDAGFNITHMEEFHPDRNDHDLWFYKNLAQAKADNYMKFDWEQNPWAVLPQWIGFSAKKVGSNQNRIMR